MKLDQYVVPCFSFEVVDDCVAHHILNKAIICTCLLNKMSYLTIPGL